MSVRSMATGLATILLVACSASPPDAAATSAEELSARGRAPWCNPGHTADDEEGDFNGFGGRSCSDARSKAECAGLGGMWCKGYVDDQILLCACKDTRKAPTCADDALSSGKLQPGARGGPDARSAVSCASGYALCRVDPKGPNNDVCSDAEDCYACSR